MSGLQSFHVTAPYATSECLVYAPHKTQHMSVGVTADNYLTHAGPWSYQNYGMFTVNSTSKLRQPAMGDFLRYDFYNQGCDAATCPSSATCPGGSPVTSSAETKTMLDRAFTSMDSGTFIVPDSKLPAMWLNNTC